MVQDTDKEIPTQRPVRIAVSIPTEGVTTPASYDNRLLMAYHMGKLEAKYPNKFEFFWYTAGNMLTPYARELLAQAAYDNDIDLIFMIDDDMLAPVDIFERLYHCMEINPNVDIVAPLAFTRNPPHLPVIYSCSEGYDHLKNEKYFINRYVRNYPKNKLVECDAVGFGAVLIKVNILDKMAKPWFMSTSATGEDVLFCYKAKKVGARVFMDTSTKLGHLGAPIVVDEPYAERHWAEKGEDVEKQFSEYKKYETHETEYDRAR